MGVEILPISTRTDKLCNSTCLIGYCLSRDLALILFSLEMDVLGKLCEKALVLTEGAYKVI